MLTKVALDSVFPHANENCETRTTLQNRQWEKGSQEKVPSSATGTRLRGAGETCVHTGWLITATGQLRGCPVGGNGLRSPWPAQTTFFFSRSYAHHTRSVKQRRNERNQSAYLRRRCSLRRLRHISRDHLSHDQTEGTTREDAHKNPERADVL
jgi:hypothetical protein